VNNATEDPAEVVRSLTDGLGADVAIEAVGVPATFELAVRLARPGGRIANIGVHGEPATLHLEEQWIRNITITTGLVDAYSTATLLRLATLHLEEQWIRNITITTGLVDAYSTATLLRLVTSRNIDASRFITHRFALDEFEAAYDVFGRAADTGALKVVLSRTS